MNSLLSFFFAIVLVAFLLFIPIFYNLKKYYIPINNYDEEIIKRFASLFNEFRFKEKRQSVLFYKTFSNLRKLWLAYIVVV